MKGKIFISALITGMCLILAFFSATAGSWNVVIVSLAIAIVSNILLLTSIKDIWRYEKMYGKKKEDIKIEMPKPEEEAPEKVEEETPKEIEMIESIDTTTKVVEPKVIQETNKDKIDKLVKKLEDEVDGTYLKIEIKRKIKGKSPKGVYKLLYALEHKDPDVVSVKIDNTFIYQDEREIAKTENDEEDYY